MSSPEEQHSGDDRRLTVIFVPHGDLETRSFVISYAKLKVLLVAAVALVLAYAVTLAILFPVMSQAARVPRLEAELRQLDSERARVVELHRALEEVEEQYERVRQLLGADAPAAGDPVLPPLRGDTNRTEPQEDAAAAAAATNLVTLWPLTTPGFITRTLSGGATQHPGLDIATAQNAQIRATGPGRVRVAGIDDVYGQYVVLDHGSGVESVYGHASRLLVTAGDLVERGDVIALTGSTGRSTAPHLHFEVRLGGRAVDPLRFVRQP
jgi:murein DD-endopeptidase MepM/ murein hydrolase activator NlpD